MTVKLHSSIDGQMSWHRKWKCGFCFLFSFIYNIYKFNWNRKSIAICWRLWTNSLTVKNVWLFTDILCNPCQNNNSFRVMAKIRLNQSHDSSQSQDSVVHCSCCCYSHYMMISPHYLYYEMKITYGILYKWGESRNTIHWIVCIILTLNSGFFVNLLVYSLSRAILNLILVKKIYFKKFYRWKN